MIKKIIYKKAKNFVERVLKEESQNIRRELDRRALRSTAEYVGEKMSYVSSVDTKYKVHDVAVNNISILEGVVIEFGVYKGDTINYIARKLPSFDVFGFDSFEGLPEFWRDGFDKGTFSLNSLPEVEKNVKLYKGWFDDTLPQFVKENKQKIAYLHVDCDLYNSTKLIFEYLKDRILQGTVIVFDEYFNYPDWEKGEFKAFQEFITKTGRKYLYLTFNHLHEQVALKIVE